MILRGIPCGRKFQNKGKGQEKDELNREGERKRVGILDLKIYIEICFDMETWKNSRERKRERVSVQKN
mgnify:CR=1 FL=1